MTPLGQIILAAVMAGFVAIAVTIAIDLCVAFPESTHPELCFLYNFYWATMKLSRSSIRSKVTTQPHFWRYLVIMDFVYSYVFI